MVGNSDIIKYIQSKPFLGYTQKKNKSKKNGCLRQATPYYIFICTHGVLLHGPKRWLLKLTLNIDSHISRFDCINAYDSFVLSSTVMLPASVQCKAIITQVMTVSH